MNRQQLKDSHQTVEQPQVHRQPTSQQIVLVKPSSNKQIAPRQHQRPLQAKTTQQQQQQQQVLQLQPMDQDQSTLSITINAIPSATVTPLSGAPLGAINSLATLSPSLATISPSLATISPSTNSVQTVAAAIPVVPTVSLSSGSLAALSSGVHNGSIPTMSTFSTVVVPSALQAPTVTLTIPAGSLSSLTPGSLASLTPGSLASLTPGSLASLPNKSQASATIPIAPLPAIQTANGVFPAIQAASLPSIVAVSSNSLQCSSQSVANIPSVPIISSSINSSLGGFLPGTIIPARCINFGETVPVTSGSPLLLATSVKQPLSSHNSFLNSKNPVICPQNSG